VPGAAAALRAVSPARETRGAVPALCAYAVASATRTPVAGSTGAERIPGDGAICDRRMTTRDLSAARVEVADGSRAAAAAAAAACDGASAPLLGRG
jgi:hypothetical protein